MCSRWWNLDRYGFLICGFSSLIFKFTLYLVKNLNEPTYIVQYEFSTKKRSTMELLLTINITCSEIQTMTVNKCRFSVPCDPEEVYPYDTCTLYGSSSAIQTSCPARK